MVRTITRERGRGGGGQNIRNDNPKDVITINPRGLDNTQYMVDQLYERNTTYEMRVASEQQHRGFHSSYILIKVGFHLVLHSFFCSVLDKYGSTSSSNTAPVPTIKMDVLTLLDEVSTNEGATTALPKIVTGKKNQKRPRVKGSTEGTENSDCPQVSWCRLRKGPTLLRANNSLVPTLLLVPILPMKSTNSVNSQVHAVDPPTVEIPPEAICLSQPVAPSSSLPRNAFTSETDENFP
ncbi:hypothetical protein J1N35_018629 [Gossypium stocksii]|uniref:Uncharacterized protein n=1 Tax=Gossypium stocksii TaxID=47602 RepID=A0A9D4A550_9ROSI|nr:hypothetical protein J1N35_018629 [Gossypium stocksii]